MDSSHGNRSSLIPESGAVLRRHVDQLRIRHSSGDISTPTSEEPPIVFKDCWPLQDRSLPDPQSGSTSSTDRFKPPVFKSAGRRSVVNK